MKQDSKKGCPFRTAYYVFSNQQIQYFKEHTQHKDENPG